MKSRFAAALLLLAYASNIGCTSVREVSPHEIDEPQKRVVGAVYTSGKEIEFESVAEKQETASVEKNDRRVGGQSIRYGYLDPKAGTLDGVVKGGEPLTIPVTELSTVQIRHFSWTKSLLLTAGVLAAGYAIVFATMADF